MMLLKFSEVSQRLNCSLSNVYSLAASGRLTVVATGATGKGYRISEAELQRFIESGRHGRNTKAWPATSDPSTSQGSKFVMLDGERLRAAWRQRGGDAR